MWNWIPRLVVTSLLVVSVARAVVLPSGLDRATSAKEPTFSQIVLWGDSLSDNGNGTWLYSNRTWPDDPGYYNGRFSNGPTWIEWVAHALANDKLEDWAYGGSTVNNSRVQGFSGALMTLAVPSVLENIQEYLDRNPQLDPNALFVVTGGSNDAFYGALQPQEDPIDLAQSVARDIAHIICALADRGAHHFLVPSVPALGYSPWSRTHRPGIPGSGTSDPAFFAQFVRTFRKYFASLMQEWKHQRTLSLYASQQGSWESVGQLPLAALTGNHQGQLPSTAHVVFWQQENLYRELALGKIGDFTNVKQACLTVERDPLTGQPIGRHVCPEPDTYLFWDDYHPGAKTHEYIALHARQTLAAAYFDP